MTRQELIDYIRGNIYPNGQNQITAPMVRDAVLAVVAFMGDAATKGIGHVLFNDPGLVTGGDVFDAIRQYLTTLFKLIGETTTDIVEDPTANPVNVDGEMHYAQKGDVVTYGYKEFWWNGTTWKELGDEASWALKTITITGTGDIEGGGTLEANRTLDLTQEAKDKLAHGETAFSWFESYLENRLRLKTPYDYLNVRKGLILEPDDYATTPADLFKQVVTIDGVETTILRSKLPIVSDSFMSAGGLSANSGGGGGGISLDAMWNSLTNSVPDAYASTPINIAHIPNITVSKVSDIESWINGKGYMTNADLSNYLPLTGGTMANTNLVTNMNADLLDGVHNGLLTAQYFGYGESIDENNDLNSITPGIYTYQNNHNPSHSISTNTILLSFANRSRKDTFQILYAANSGTALFFRQTPLSDDPQYTNWSDWKTFAFTDGNVATATALQNTRYIWGQPFSGVADVSGAMSSVASIDSLLYFDTTNTRVGIGIDAPADTLDVNGSIHATSLRIGAGSPVLVWDAVNSAWHLNGSLYADGFVSAGGFSDTSGSGGIDLDAMWGSLTNSVPDDYANTPINIAHIPNLTVSKITDIENWINGKGFLTTSTAASTYLTISSAASTYQPIISDLSTIRSNASQGASAYSSLSNYLPLSGGTMTNTNLVTNMNADLLDGVHNGSLTAQYFSSGFLLTSSNNLNRISPGIYSYQDNNNPSHSISTNAVLVSFDSPARHDTFQLLYAANQSSSLYFRCSPYVGTQYENWSSWRELAFTDGTVANATNAVNASNADMLDNVHNGEVTAQYFNYGYTLSSSNDLNTISPGIYSYRDANNPSHALSTNAVLVSFASSVRKDTFQLVYAANQSSSLYFRCSPYVGSAYENWSSWRELAFADGTVANATNASFASNADMLDGVHNGEVTALYFNYGYTLTSSNDLNVVTPGIYAYRDNNNPSHALATNAVLVSFASSVRNDTFQLVYSANQGASLYFRCSPNVGTQYEGWSSWRELAFSDGNVATATALQTSRSIWGQSFNGTADVSGALSGATTGEFTNWVKASYYYVGGYTAYLEYTNSMLHSNVGFYSNAGISAGGLSTSSDIRLKTDVEAISPERAWSVVMGLRPTEFKWKESGEQSSGFIAQEVEPLIPFAVHEIGDLKRLNYDNVFTYGIAALRDMKVWRETTEQRLERLEKHILNR